MKNQIIKAIQTAVTKLNATAVVELTPSKQHGDFSTNIAMKLTKELGMAPRDIAEKLIKEIDASFIEKMEVAGPGFINIFVNSSTTSDILKNIVEQGAKFGKGNQGKYINVEYVSANPTGYLHVGHARGAALGSTLSNILLFAGNKVDQEYYINDAGNQINTLGLAAFIRYQQELGVELEMPENTYKGNDIIALAKELVGIWGDKYKGVEYSKVEKIFKDESKKRLLQEIVNDLGDFGIKMDFYSSEQAVYDSGAIDVALDKLKEHTFKEDGALWLKTIVNGDDKDRVLIKTDGTYTYLTPDIAYHDKKISRGYDELINIWGADHIGYIKRMETAIGYLGLSADKLDVLTIQLVRLIKDGEELKMSKRLGTSFTLRELLELVGKDATRFYMIDRSNNSKFDFDLDQATKQSSENPVFTLQYTHARANQLLSKSTVTPIIGTYEGKEKELIETINEFPELILRIANKHKVHLLPQYIIKVANLFNSFYSNSKIIGNEREAEMLSLVQATKNVLKTGLELIGVTALNKM